MAASVYPIPVVSTINANALTATAANVVYEARVALEPAIYTITCAAATVAIVEFYSGAGTLINTATTASGTIAISNATAADRVRLWTNTGANIVVTINKTANALSNVFSGTLDTVTTLGASTYTGTSASGYAYALVVGGGGGGWGQGGNGPNNSGGGGGTSSKLVALTGSMPVVVGAGGTAGPYQYGGGTGGTTTFAGMTATGGGSGFGGTGSGGAYNASGTSGAVNANGGIPNAVTYSSFIRSPIGTAGGYSALVSGGNGGIYGGGGATGGSNTAGTVGGAGAQGAVLIFRF